eukprot:SAG11_NODE_14_length_26344_cov_14.209411_5_plen_63_part_00
MRRNNMQVYPGSWLLVWVALTHFRIIPGYRWYEISEYRIKFRNQVPGMHTRNSAGVSGLANI